MLLFKCQFASDVGCLRKNNEDMILLNGKLYRDEESTKDIEFSSDMRFTACVADGMGGHEGGEIASELAVRAFDSFVVDLPSSLTQQQLADKLKEWVNQTHAFIVDQGINDPQYSNMGTTLVGMFGYEGNAYYINIGDSRLYRYRGGILKQLTCDHSMRELTGNKSISSGAIYNCLGAGPSAFADFIDLTGQLFDKDIFLVCSDGLSDMLNYEQLEELFKGKVTANRFVEAAKNAGGKDNVSVVLLKAESIVDD